MTRAGRRIVLAFLLAPLAAAAGVTVWRVRRVQRDAADAAAVAAADSAVRLYREERSRAAGGLPGRWPERVHEAPREFLRWLHDAGFDGALYVNGARVTAEPDGFGTDSLPLAFRSRLLREDRASAMELASGRVAAAPIKDRDDWDVIGALVVAPRRAPPPLDARAAAGLRLWIAATAIAWAVIAAIGLSLLRLLARRNRLREALAAWGFLAPSFAHLLLFSVGPILFALYLSFHRWNLVEPQRPFVGLQNYRELLRDASFWRAVANTGIYVLFVPVGMALALGLALLVDRGFRGVRLLRAVFFLPYITSFVAISLVWKWMFEPDFGLLNAALRLLHLPPSPWLASPATALPSLMLMSIWMYAGYMMILFLAGLQSIPRGLYESARLDGAGAWQRFRRITLPLLRPTTFFVLTTMIIFMFQVFTAVYVMTEGGPVHATDVVVYHIYRSAWEYLRMGYASAMAWVLFAIIFVVTLAQWRLLGSRGVE